MSNWKDTQRDQAKLPLEVELKRNIILLRKELEALKQWQKEAMKIFKDIEECGYVVYDEDADAIETLIKQAEEE